MKIVICGSIDFTPKIKEVANILVKRGNKVEIPFTSKLIIDGKLSLNDFKSEKRKNGDNKFREEAMSKFKIDVVKRYYNEIKESDAILVLNFKKKGITNYIGGNTFLEMGFAYVLNKKIFLFNEIPEMIYTDELQTMQPIIINGDFSKIK